jgi:hypothetical protein
MLVIASGAVADNGLTQIHEPADAQNPCRGAVQIDAWLAT